MIHVVSPLIHVDVRRNGVVRLVPKKQSHVRILREIDYVRETDGRFGTWWTYLPDLKRDLGALSYERDTLPNLRILSGAVSIIPSGSEAEIRALFTKERQPHPFQVKGIETTFYRETLLLADSVGLGKTPQSLGALLLAHKRRLLKRAVIICPAGIKLQWYEEIHAFAKPSALPGHVAIAQGTPERRLQIYASNWRVLIVNPELVRQDEEMLRAFTKDVNFVILDEAGVIRNTETSTSQTIKRLFSNARFRIALTATPIENSLIDLYSIFEWVDRKVFLSWEYFSRRYIVWKTISFVVRTKRGGKVNVRKQEPVRYINLGEVRVKIRGSYLRRTVDEVGVELPKLIVLWERLTLPPKQREAYESCKADAVKRIKGLRGQALYAPLIALRQACNSTSLVTKNYDTKPSQVKVDRLKELLSTELGGEQVVIFTEYERFVRQLMTDLHRFRPVSYTGKMNRREKALAIAAFKAGDRRVFIATKAAERGHNLQNAGVLINLDLPFNPAVLKQRIGRIRRLKSKHQNVRIINMIAVGTVEETVILRKIYGKRQLFESVFDDDELTKADPLSRMSGADVGSLL